MELELDLDVLTTQPTIEDIENNNSLEFDEESNTLVSSDYPLTLSLRRTDIVEEKEMNKFIKACEGMIRHSIEYKLWTSYVKEALGLKVCSVTGEVNDETRVEIHHHPFTLYDITKGVILRYIASSKEFCSFDVALDVIQLHYQMYAPFCLLVSSIHEKYHNGFINIPMEIVKGDTKYFISTYGSFMDDETLSGFYNKLNINKENCGWYKNDQNIYTWNLSPTNTKKEDSEEDISIMM